MAAFRSSSQRDDVLVRELLQRQLHHADGPLDDLEPGRDDGGGLLAAEHRLGDLGRVGEVADPGLDDADAGPLEALGELLLEDAVHVVGASAQASSVSSASSSKVSYGYRPARWRTAASLWTTT